MRILFKILKVVSIIFIIISSIGIGVWFVDLINGVTPDSIVIQIILLIFGVILLRFTKHKLG